MYYLFNRQREALFTQRDLLSTGDDGPVAAHLTSCYRYRCRGAQIASCFTFLERPRLPASFHCIRCFKKKRSNAHSHTNSRGLIKVTCMKLHWKPALLDYFLHVLHFLNVALSIFIFLFLTKSISRPTELKQCRNGFSVNRSWITALQLF